MLAILLAVALVFTMTVSVSASKRLDINGQIVVGTLAWSGTPYVYETLTSTTTMRFADFEYTLGAGLSGIYRLNNGYAYPTNYGYISGPNDGNPIGLSVSVENGCWLQGTGTFDAYYGDLHTTATETKTWDV